MFYGDYIKARSCLDYTFHKIYTKERQLLQDGIITKALAKKVSSDKPRLYLTAGAMGAGKTHVIREMLGASFPTYVLADVDRIRHQLPENGYLCKTDPVNTGIMLHSESCSIHEIIFRTAIYEKLNVIIDGSLRNGEFFKGLITNWKETTPYDIVIVHVKARLETCLKRAEKREKITGRHVPVESIEKSIKECPKSVELLRPLVDKVITIEND